MKTIKLLIISLIISFAVVANADNGGMLNSGIDVDIIQERSGNLNISGSTCASATITITSPNGTIIFQTSGLDENGFFLTVQTENWSTGTYIVNISSNNPNCGIMEFIQIN